jgi:VanZ family protein
MRATQASSSARSFGWLALGFLAFATYGSLVPLDFRPLPAAEAVEHYREAWMVPIRVGSRSDWLSNILLFTPLGYLLAGWLSVDRPRRALVAVAVAVPVTSATLSAAIEFAQVYFPSRTVSARDVVAETLGGTIGGVAWLAARRLLAVPSWWGDIGRRERAAWLLPAYLVALLLSHDLPLDLGISPADLYHKYKNGMICLVPFGSGEPGSSTLRRLADEASSFLVAGLLLARFDRRPRSFWVLLATGMALAALVEFSQLFIASRRFDATDIAVGGLAAFAGHAAGGALMADAAAWSRTACLGCWLGLVAMISWLPLDFNLDLGAWSDRASRVELVPFVDYYRVSVLNAGDQLFGKAALFIPLGMMLGMSWWRTLLVAILVAAPFEAGQLALPGRVPSLTDFIVEVGGAWIGQLVPLASPAPARVRRAAPSQAVTP